MDTICVRTAMPGDIPGICHVNRGEEGPWADISTCEKWVLNRMANGFYVQVAEINGAIVGHGEWKLSDEYRWKTLYLGQLQIDPDFQKRGIGRKMLADGIALAKKLNCDSISLIPETATDSQLFYAKCGLLRGRDIYSCILPSEKGTVTGKRTAEADAACIKDFPFLFGLTQTASAHMWQVYNRRPAGEGRMVDTICGEDFCIQLGGFSISRPALLLAWGKYEKAAEIVRNSLAFAYELGYPGVTFWFFPELLGLFSGKDAKTNEYEMYMNIIGGN